MTEEEADRGGAEEEKAGVTERLRLARKGRDRTDGRTDADLVPVTPGGSGAESRRA